METSRPPEKSPPLAISLQLAKGLPLEKSPPLDPIMPLMFLKDLQKLVPASRTSFYRWEREGRFPNRVRVGSRAAWHTEEILAWMGKLPRGMVGNLPEPTCTRGPS